jgi:hypothetical protein
MTSFMTSSKTTIGKLLMVNAKCPTLNNAVIFDNVLLHYLSVGMYQQAHEWIWILFLIMVFVSPQIFKSLWFFDESAYTVYNQLLAVYFSSLFTDTNSYTDCANK